MTPVEYVACHMRERDRREIYGLRDIEDWRVIAAETLCAEAWQVFRHNETPAAVCGVHRLRQGVYSAFAYGTDDWPFVVKDCTRWVKERLMPWLHARAHRLECQSHAEHKDAHRWLVYLGARRECVLSGYGKDGSDYYQYVWTR